MSQINRFGGFYFVFIENLFIFAKNLDIMEIKRTTRSHYKIINGQLIPKKSYNTEKEGLIVTRFLNSRPEAIHQMIVYKCNQCNKWHIGSTGKLLSDDDKRKYEIKLKNNMY